VTAQKFEPDKLFEPVAWDAFFATHWERNYLHVSHRDPGHYDALITSGALESLVSRQDARYPAIQLAKGGGYYAPEIYTRNVRHGEESFAGLVDVQRVIEEYRRGATVAIPAIHRTWRPLGELCDKLQARLDHPAHANVYITPGNAAGFTPHYDVHEVFVLQIAGKKRWSIYAPIIPLPHRSQTFAPHLYTGQKPVAEVDMVAGDLLYLPRGWLHSTVTGDSFSAHVTLGVTVYTWVDLIKEYLSAAVDTRELRAALPPGFASQRELQPALRDNLLKALDELRAGTDANPLIEAFTSRVRAANVARHAGFEADVVAIDGESRFQMPLASSYKIILEGKSVMLEFKGQRYGLTEPVAATLRVMAESKTFSAAGLPDLLPLEARLGLCRHLHDIGFVTLLTANARHLTQS